MASQQPQGGPVQIDWSNPLSEGLSVAATPFSAFSQVPTLQANKIGVGARGGLLKMPPVAGTVNNATILALIAYSGVDTSANFWLANGNIYSDSSQAWPNARGLRLQTPQSYGRARLAATDSGNSTHVAVIDVTPAGNPARGDILTMVVTVGEDYLITAYNNGVAQGTSTVFQGKTFSPQLSTNSAPNYGMEAANVDDTVTHLCLLLRWNRELSSAEVREISNNPWQVFFDEDEETEGLFPVSAGGGVDTPIDPGLGALTITGYAPTVVQTLNQVIEPNNSSLSLTGYSPLVVRTNHQKITPNIGALVFTGYAPAVTQSSGNGVLPTSGSLAITGYAPSILQPQSILPQVSTIAITGYAPSVTQGVTTTVSPTTGVLTLSGYSPVVAQSDHQQVNAAVGELVFTGYAPAVVQTAHRAVSPGVGGLTLTGHSPTVTQQIIGLDPRYARPASTVIAGSWTPSTGVSLADMLDEPSADSADYISTAGPSTCEIKINPVVDPGTNTGHVVRYQVWSPEGNNLVVTLKQGNVTIASWEHFPLPLEPTIFPRALSPAECDSITDYNDLRFEFTAA